jgi:hypothetical protein
MSKKLEKEIFIHVKKEIWDTNYTVHIFDSSYEEHGYILVGTKSVNVEIPDDDAIILKHVQFLQQKEQKLKADFVVAQEKIKDQIQALLQIKDKSNE